jgi:phage protein D
VDLNDLIQAISERQQAMESQLSSLAGALKALQARVAEVPELQAAAAQAAEKQAAPAAAKQTEQRGDEQVTPETLVMIAAAVTAFLGKKVRIRSARRLRTPHSEMNPWSQQGRVLIHASHNPRSRG